MDLSEGGGVGGAAGEEADGGFHVGAGGVGDADGSGGAEQDDGGGHEVEREAALAK